MKDTPPSVAATLHHTPLVDHKPWGLKTLHHRLSRSTPASSCQVFFIIPRQKARTSFQKGYVISSKSGRSPTPAANYESLALSHRYPGQAASRRSTRADLPVDLLLERGPGCAFYCWWMDCRRPLSRRWHGARVVHDVTPSENLGSSPKVINPSPREQPARDRVPRSIITLPSVSLDILSSTPHTSPVPTTRELCGY